MLDGKYVLRERIGHGGMGIAALVPTDIDNRRTLMVRRHVFDSYLDTASAWLQPVIADLHLAPGEHPRAVLALRAGLHAIRDRLPVAEVVTLGAQLPALLRGIYYEGWRVANDPTRIRDRAAMLARVEQELGSDPRLDPTDVLRSVIRLLIEHVSPGEIREVLATLPSIASLWHELTSAAPEARARNQRVSQVRRTGHAQEAVRGRKTVH